jgi:hypothetical protein
MAERARPGIASRNSVPRSAAARTVLWLTDAWGLGFGVMIALELG